MAHAARPPQPKDAYDGKAQRGTLTCVISGIDILIVAEPIAEGGFLKCKAFTCAFLFGVPCCHDGFRHGSKKPEPCAQGGRGVLTMIRSS